MDTVIAIRISFTPPIQNNKSYRLILRKLRMIRQLPRESRTPHRSPIKLAPKNKNTLKKTITDEQIAINKLLTRTKTGQTRIHEAKEKSNKQLTKNVESAANQKANRRGKSQHPIFFSTNPTERVLKEDQGLKMEDAYRDASRTRADFMPFDPEFVGIESLPYKSLSVC